MKIVVCVEPAGLGAGSRAALALARRLAPEAAVVALSAGGARGTAGAAQALEAGATRAVRVVDAGLEAADYPAIGEALARAARRLEADLVVAGTASDEEGRGVVPAALAHHLGAPLVARAEDVRLAGGTLEARVRLGGRRVRLAVELPAVVTVPPAPEAAPAAATDGAVEEIALAELGMDPASLARRPGLAGTLERPRRRAVTVKSAAELVQRWLRD